MGSDKVRRYVCTYEHNYPERDSDYTLSEIELRFNFCEKTNLAGGTKIGRMIPSRSRPLVSMPIAPAGKSIRLLISYVTDRENKL